MHAVVGATMGRVTPAATIIAIALTRATIAGTLAYAVCPMPWLVVAAIAFDALSGVATGLRAVRGASPSDRLVYLELSAKALLLWIASGTLFGAWEVDLLSGDGRSWIMGNVGTVLVWFSPIAVGRIAIVLLVEPWRTPRLHDNERERQALLAIGMTLLLTAGSVTLLLRSTGIIVVTLVSAVTGIVLVVAAAVIGMRRRRWLAAVRSGEIATHRLVPIDESPNEVPALDEAADSVVVACSGPQTFRSADSAVARVRATGRSWLDARRLAAFSFLAAVVTGGFDAACWHGSGWIPVRHEHGDRLLRPRYLRASGVMEWTILSDPPRSAYWKIGKARFMSDVDRFESSSANLTADMLVRHVPQSACGERGLILRRRIGLSGVSARSLDERARIVDPIKRDDRLIYTYRRRDDHLVRVALTLDGTSSTCTIDPPRVDDGEPGSLIGAHSLALGGARSCAVVDDTALCWGRNNWYGREVSQAIPERVDVAFPFEAGDTTTCRTADERIDCWRSGAIADAERLPFGSDVIGMISKPGEMRVVLADAPLDPPLAKDVRHLALATDRACAVLSNQSLRCWGSKAPRLERATGVLHVAVGASLACFRDRSNAVWCASGDAVPKMVEGLPEVFALDVGDAHACAIDAKDAVWCWGRNASGAVGDGTTIDRPRAVRVLSDALEIATGAAHSCAIGLDRKVRCWGANGAGQLGDGTYVDRYMPTGVVW